jgi:hypothetical protein
MQQCRSGVALPADGERRRPLSLSCLLSVTAAVALAVIAFLALSPAAQAGAPPVTFCQVTGLSACAGPITSSSQNISGAGQQRIEEHLQQLRCKDSNDPNCNAVGAAAADSVSYAGLSFFVSGDYEHKDRTATGAELGFDSNAFGPTIGVDYRLAPNAVIGGAFDYDHTIGDFDAKYGDFDTTPSRSSSSAPTIREISRSSMRPSGSAPSNMTRGTTIPAPAPTTPSKVTPADSNSAPISPAATTSASGPSPSGRARGFTTSAPSSTALRRPEPAHCSPIPTRSTIR